MDPTTTNFEELTSHWSSSDNVYGSGFQLNNTTPNSIFNTAFSDNSNKFFTDLIKSPSTQHSISSWNIKSNDPKSEYNTIKQRNLTIKAIENGIAFCLDKNVTTNITQTAFFTSNSIIIYSVSQIETANQKHNYLIIDRWTIKTHLKGVTIAINANILWNNYQSQTAAVIKAKWLRFYQSHFETWRHLIKQHIDCKFIGVWNKLNSYQTLNMTIDKIEYSDGTKINISINKKTNEIIAYYSRKKFKGKLIEKNKYIFIEWDNHSIWVKNGFAQFRGKYKNNKNKQIYNINKFGIITIPITQKQIKFQLLKYNQIKYISTDSIVNKGILLDNDNIKWGNGNIWEKEQIKIESEPDIAVENVIPAAGHIETEEKLDCEIKNKKTVEIEGEMDDIESIEDINFFEQDLSLEVNNYEHFVLVNDELFNEKDEKLDDGGVDEWLLV
eukprot:87706_1